MSSADLTQSDHLKINIHLLLAIGLVILFHGALLPYTSGNSYDAYIHMFFGDHYVRSWFDPWEPRWYTGFTTTSYPPGAHMAIAALSRIVPLYAAFNIVMLAGLCTMVLGVYRFSLLFVSARGSGYAALAAVFSSSIVETVHLFGQLPTIFSLGLFLNCLPHVYRWLVTGKLQQLALATAFAGAATAAHHVTTIFGTLLFIGPVAVYAWIAYLDVDPRWRQTGSSLLKRAWYAALPAVRGAPLALLLILTVVMIVYPYWYWSATDPITQVSIPHGSRESFLKRTDLGLMFFVIPWGMAILVLPYVALKSVTSRMWPLALSVFLCFVLGTGGTTPIPRILLRGAFDILTLDRFTFWATILILPFVGMLIESALHGRLGHALRNAIGGRLFDLTIAGGFFLFVGIAITVAMLSTIRPTQPRNIDATPIVNFMSEDQHDRWRYLTLGFGDQFAYISAQMNARSVDGNYHSARRLPELVGYAVERLENSKYLGVPGLGSLQQFLANSDKYHLKFVFSNDAFYDPLLHFSGWNRLLRLPNGIVVWEKPDVTPLPTIEPRRSFPLVHRLMWGTLPPAALLIGYLVLIVTVLRRGAGFIPDEYRPITLGRGVDEDVKRTRLAIVALAGMFAIGVAAATTAIVIKLNEKPGGDEVLARYYHHLDFRQFEQAYALLAPAEGLDYETFLLWQRWKGGMIASYAKLTGFEAERLSANGDSADWLVRTEYLTPFDTVSTTAQHRTLLIDGEWRVTGEYPGGSKPPERIQSEPTVSWYRSGRRQPTKDDVHGDIMDRPRLAVLDARLMKSDGKYRLVGTVRNEDVDPAAVKYSGVLRSASGASIAGQQAGPGSSHRLLPGETGFFDIAFEGVLSLDSALQEGGFDPKLYIPLEFGEPPAAADLSVAAVVNESNLYRSLTITALETRQAESGHVLSALLTNSGTEQSEIVQMQLAFFDAEGRIVATKSAFLEGDLKPGQSRGIEVSIAKATEHVVIAELGPDAIRTNLKVENALDRRLAPRYLPGFLPLAPETGFSGVAVTYSAMNFRPLF